MANNFNQPGDVVDYTAPGGGVVSGTAYQIGQAVVVALKSAAAGAKFPGQHVGVFSVTKAGSQAWAEGDLVFFDGSVFTTTATGNVPAGSAVEAVGAGAGETTGKVRLNGAAAADSA